MYNELPIPVVDVLLSNVLAIGREVVAGRRVYVAAAHEEEDVAAARACRRCDDVSTAARHVARRAVPLLPAVRLQVLQVERVPVVQQQRLARPRRHVHCWHCVKIQHVTTGIRLTAFETPPTECTDEPLTKHTATV